MNRPIIPYNPKLVQRAKKLRNNSTLSEIILWKYLKGNEMCGFDFHRQRPVDNYIVDFICCELYLVIELDGYTHLLEETAHKDMKREKKLKQLGLRVIRFWDEQIYDNIDRVLRTIENVVLERKKKLKL